MVTETAVKQSKPDSRNSSKLKKQVKYGSIIIIIILLFLYRVREHNKIISQTPRKKEEKKYWENTFENKYHIIGYNCSCLIRVERGVDVKVSWCRKV